MRHKEPDPEWPKPDYERIAELEIELQDGPAWDRMQEIRNQDIQRRAREQEARDAVEATYTARDREMMRLKDENPEEFFRQIAYDTWRRDERQRNGR